MQSIHIYGLKTCDTCRKAVKALEAEGHTVTFLDLRSEVDDLARKVSDWVAVCGTEVLVNKRSTTWRTLSDTQRAETSGPAAVGVLIAYPSLIKRPVIEVAGKVYVGWNEDVQAALL